MENKFNDWFNQVNSKSIEAEDSSNYAQCFDLAFNWCDFLGIPRDSIRHLHAYQIFSDPNPDTTDYWDLIANTPTNVPQVGDLMIWGTLVGVSGHVAVFKEGDATQFTSEDQNWSGLQYARPVKHSYNGVIGFLRSKNQFLPLVEPQPEPPVVVQPIPPETPVETPTEPSVPPVEPLPPQPVTLWQLILNFLKSIFK